MTPLDFLEQMYAGCEPGWLSLFTIDRHAGANRVHWYRTDQLADIVTDIDPGRCTWFGVATRAEQLDDGMRGGAADCMQVPALWLDVDVVGPTHKTTKTLPPDKTAALELIADHPVAPTVTVDTGGGLQSWWILDEPLDVATGQAQTELDDWRDTWQTLGARRGWHVDNVFDVPRIMRLPGTRNTKGVNRG